MYETSTFDGPLPEGMPNHVYKGIRELDVAGVFNTIKPDPLKKLSSVHFNALKKRIEKYKLLYIVDGSLFAPGNKDKAILAYEPEMNRLAILLYNDSDGSMGELYRDYKVENGLKNADCNYSAFGTLDYQLASSISYQKEDLLKNPERFSENIPLLITDFAKNENYAPDGGCFSAKVPKKPNNVLCIATSFVYNNWECLKYNKDTKSFLIYYGQAFAD